MPSLASDRARNDWPERQTRARYRCSISKEEARIRGTRPGFSLTGPQVLPRSGDQSFQTNWFRPLWRAFFLEN